MLQVVHCGLDTIVATFPARISEDLSDTLASAKWEAEHQGRSQTVQIGDVEFEVKPQSEENYQFILSAPKSLSTWSLRRHGAGGKHLIKVRLGSELLTLNGLSHAIEHTAKILALLAPCAVFDHAFITRVDACVDILAPGFELDRTALRQHHRMSVQDYFEVNELGGAMAIHSIKTGKLPNFQVTLYDKTKEVRSKNCARWWLIWNDRLKAIGAPRLDPRDESHSAIWRIEVRLGPDFLADHTSSRSWFMFQDDLSALLKTAMEKVRYAPRCEGQINPTRWSTAPIWILAKQALTNNLDWGSLDQDLRKDVIRADIDAMIFDRLRTIRGSLNTIAVLKGDKFAGLYDAYRTTIEDLIRREVRDPESALKRFNVAKKRVAKYAHCRDARSVSE